MLNIEISLITVRKTQKFLVYHAHWNPTDDVLQEILFYKLFERKKPAITSPQKQK